ncbi:MAG TPA: peptide chain release factor 3 [Candidatus Omnitrophota bacterium]|nr:peptide chain release factor 3 [Candidatus Omnitrophota bacterium]
MNKVTADTLREIKKRRTFAIISHPDAGKTTVTEKLLFFGNAIQMAGVVKAKRAKHFARSDWLEIEKQRGISVTSSVMQFSYGGREINLLDTPGHQDFSEDTYRVLTAVDSVLMIIDSSKGIETQTKKLFQVCRERNLPIMTFINKMDLEGRDPFQLIDEIEKNLNLSCCIMTWPIGQGGRFKGVYDLNQKRIRIVSATLKMRDLEQEFFENLDDPILIEKVESDRIEKLKEDLELLSGAGHEFDRELFLKGNLSPVFFGSAVKNFGIQEFLENFLKEAPSPRPCPAEERMVEPDEADFTGIVFKIQANMDPKHRDRTAFVRICSGEFVQGMSVYHVRQDKTFKINNAIQFLSQERSNIDRAYAGDIIGIFDRGTLNIGDTMTKGEQLKFIGIPQFSPDLFYRVSLKNPIKNKQLHKGLEHLAAEGASQLFRKKYNSDTILGVVGQLQAEVVKFRLLNEYGADAVFSPMNYQFSRWYTSKNKKALDTFESQYAGHIVYDIRELPLILFQSEWEKDYIAGKNPEIEFFSSLVNVS